MKRVILLVGIIAVGFLAEGQMYAQRQNRDGRGNRNEKVERRGGNKNNDRKKGYDNRNTRKGRNETVVRRTVVKRGGYRHVTPNRNRNVRVNTVYYDYDFRNGRRNTIHRNVRPSTRHIWVNGYWEFNRRLRRDVWVAGHWTLKRDYHRWQEGHYSVLGGVRIWVPGIWIRVF